MLNIRRIIRVKEGGNPVHLIRDVKIEMCDPTEVYQRWEEELINTLLKNIIERRQL